MAASSGRDFLVKKNGTAIACLRETSASFDGSPIDITNKDSNGFRTLASFAGTRALDITGAGVVDDAVLRDIAQDPAASQLLTDITLEYPDGVVISGNFYMATFEYAGNNDNENTYTVTFQSAGQWTVTP